MNTKLDTRLKAETAAQTVSLTHNVIIEAVASAVQSHSLKNLGGIDKIEYVNHAEVAQLSIAGTVFGVMADKARMLGLTVDDTVGGVMEAVYGLDRHSPLVREYAHEIGCHCKGEFISPDVAASRILNASTLSNA